MICKNRKEYERVTQRMLEQLECDLNQSLFNINSGDIIAKGTNIELKDQYLSAKTKDCIKVVSYEDIKGIWVRQEGNIEEKDRNKIGFDLS